MADRTRKVTIAALRLYAAEQYREAYALREGRRTESRPTANHWTDAKREAAARIATRNERTATERANELEGGAI